jgi:hypothetical protein
MNFEKTSLRKFQLKEIPDPTERKYYTRDFFDYDKIWGYGFPYASFTKDYIYDFNQLSDHYYKGLFNNFEKKYVNNSPIHARLANVFFPGLYKVKVEGFKDPYSAYFTEKGLQIALWLAFKDGASNPKLGKLRVVLGNVSGVQAATNFRPGAAKCIYDYFGSGLKVFDYSCGFGGRLVGFLASEAEEYVGVDVNEDNFEGYRKIIESYTSFERLEEDDYLKVHYRCRKDNLFAKDKVVKIYLSGSEDFFPLQYKDYFDLSFSSPPYFSKERYSDEENQCFNKFFSYKSWVRYYWYKTLKNQYKMLKKNGVCGVNIMDVTIKNKEYKLVKLTERLLKLSGFKKDDFLFYEHRKTPFSFSKEGENFNEETVKIEPILIYRKE